MSKFKDLIDEYLKNNYSNISTAKSRVDFRWADIANSLEKECKLQDVDPEYVRGRWRKIFKPVTSTISATIPNSQVVYDYKEDRIKGTAELKVQVDEKLSDDEIFQKYNVNKEQFKISQVWYKDKSSGGYIMSVLFTALKGKEEAINYKKTFEDFINSLNIKVLNRTKIEIPKPYAKGKKHCLYLPIFDAHIGKLAHKSTSGDDYDLDIAINRYKDAIKNLVLSATASYDFDEVCLVTGSDLLHVDSKANETTSGTPQDADSRFEKVYEKTLSLLVETVDFLKSLAPVKLIIVRGNHAEHLEYTLGVTLKWLYKDDKEVEVDAEAFLRKYYQYGNTGVMICHGDKEKHDNLPLIFATENKKLWAETEYHQIHLGHLHTDKKKVFLTSNEYSGCQVSIFPSLSGDDYWHAGKGYNLNNKRAVAIVFDKEKGEVAKLNYTV